MGYDEGFHIKKKNGQYVVDEYGECICEDIKEVTNNFFKAIKSILEWNEWDFWNDNIPEAKYVDDWTKILK